jgi:hypothetical protein
MKVRRSHPGGGSSKGPWYLLAVAIVFYVTGTAAFIQLMVSPNVFVMAVFLVSYLGAIMFQTRWSRGTWTE